MADKKTLVAYAEDLAYIHDSMPDFAEGSAPGLLDLFRTTRLNDGLVVDLGCGSGIWANHLITAGYDVVGVDISPAMIEMCRNRVPGATFHVSSYLDFKIPNCRIVTALGEVLGYLMDKTNSPTALSRVCRRVFDALEPGGLFVFDLAEIGIDRNRTKTYWEGNDWACLVEFEANDDEKSLTRHIVTFRKIGKLYRRHEEVHRLRLYRPAEVASMLRQVGFRVRTVRQYGDYPLLKKRVGFVARKP